MIAVIYTAAGKMLVSGAAVNDAIMAMIKDVSPAADVRLIDGTELANIGTALDPRLPATLAAFDLAYPDAQVWTPAP
jgi:hypothetical protein